MTTVGAGFTDAVDCFEQPGKATQTAAASTIARDVMVKEYFIVPTQKASSQTYF
jgi:hypothetical protein